MPFKSEKQRKWMHANKPKMAKKWEKEEKSVEEDRDYKDEYKKFQSSKKAKKYRAELNKYNRQKGTYGNNDGKDASHKGGKIVGFESQSKNRGRSEKSRLKKEEIMNWLGGYDDEFKFKKGQLIKDINPNCPHHGSEGVVTKVTKDEVTYTVRNNGRTYKVGDELTKTKDQLAPLSVEFVTEAVNFSKISTSKLVKTYKQMADKRLSGSSALTFRLIAKELIKRKAKLEGGKDCCDNCKEGKVCCDVHEAISKDEWAQYPKYARKLKPYMKKLLKVPVRVRVIKQANHNPWIEVRVARFGKDIIPNDFRKKALKVTGGGRPRDMDNITYGNITAGSISMKHDQWVKLLGNKVKSESLNEAKILTDKEWRIAHGIFIRNKFFPTMQKNFERAIKNKDNHNFRTAIESVIRYMRSAPKTQLKMKIKESVNEAWSTGLERYKVTLENGKEIDVKVKEGKGLEGLEELLGKEGLKFDKITKKASRPTLTLELVNEDNFRSRAQDDIDEIHTFVKYLASKIAKEDRKHGTKATREYIKFYKQYYMKFHHGVIKSAFNLLADGVIKKESVDESGILYRAGVKKYGKEGMRKIQQAAGKRKSHAEIGKIKDKYEKDKKGEGLDPYKDFNQQDNDKEYDLNLGSFIDKYQKMMKFMKKYKEVPDKNKRAWASAIRKKVGKSRFNGLIDDWGQVVQYLKSYEKFRNKKDAYAWDIKGESIDEGFGSAELMDAKDLAKFEKTRQKNAEVLGYKLTGKSDIKPIKEKSKVTK